MLKLRVWTRYVGVDAVAARCAQAAPAAARSAALMIPIAIRLLFDMASSSVVLGGLSSARMCEAGADGPDFQGPHGPSCGLCLGNRGAYRRVEAGELLQVLGACGFEVGDDLCVLVAPALA